MVNGVSRSKYSDSAENEYEEIGEPAGFIGETPNNSEDKRKCLF